MSFCFVLPCHPFDILLETKNENKNVYTKEHTYTHKNNNSSSRMKKETHIKISMDLFMQLSQQTEGFTNK